MPQTTLNLAVEYWNSSRSMLSNIVHFEQNSEEMREQLEKLQKKELAYERLIKELSENVEMLNYSMKLIKSKKKETPIIDKQIALHIILLSEDETLWKKVMEFNKSSEYRELIINGIVKRFIFLNREPFTLLSKELSLKFFNFLKEYSPLYFDDVSEICANNRWNEYESEIIEILKQPDPDILGFDKDFIVDSLGYFGLGNYTPYLVDELKYKIENDKNTEYVVNALLLSGYPKDNFEAFIENNNDQTFHVSTISQYGHPSLLKSYKAQTELWEDSENRFNSMLSKAVGSFRTPLIIDWLLELLCHEYEEVRATAHYGIASFLEKDVYDETKVLQLEYEREDKATECKKLRAYWESRADDIAKLDKTARYQQNELFDFGKIFTKNIYEQFDNNSELQTWINSAIIYTGNHQLPYNPYGYGYQQVKQVNAWLEYFKTNPLKAGKWYRYGIDVGNTPAMSKEELKNKRFSEE